MAGFEVIVRPVVLPNIRPAPARALPIDDAPDKGLAVISGGGASGIINLSHSESHSWSRSRSVEVKRYYTKARIYYTRPDGTVDYSKYWEFEVLSAIEYLENGKTVSRYSFSPMEESANIDIISRGNTRSTEPK